MNHGSNSLVADKAAIFYWVKNLILTVAEFITVEVRVTPGKSTGQFKLSGAKNSALRLMAASPSTQHDIALKRLPGSILDTGIQIDMLERVWLESVFPGELWYELSRCHHHAGNAGSVFERARHRSCRYPKPNILLLGRC
jgi:hypothetical protein